MNKRDSNPFYRDSKSKRIVKLLKRNGFEYIGGTKHEKYRRDEDDHIVVVPRHKVITPSTTKSICEDLRDLHGIDEDEIKTIF